MFPGKHLEHMGSMASRSKANSTEISRVPFVFAFLEKSESVLTLDSSDFNVPASAPEGLISNPHLKWGSVTKGVLSCYCS